MFLFVISLEYKDSNVIFSSLRPFPGQLIGPNPISQLLLYLCKLLMEFETEAVNFGKSIIVPSVQELAKQTIFSLPPRYLRPDQDHPIVPSNTWLPSIPVIDLQKLLVGDSIDKELERLHSACREWGFFQVREF